MSYDIQHGSLMTHGWLRQQRKGKADRYYHPLYHAKLVSKASAYRFLIAFLHQKDAQGNCLNQGGMLDQNGSSLR